MATPQEPTHSQVTRESEGSSPLKSSQREPEKTSLHATAPPHRPKPPQERDARQLARAEFEADGVLHPTYQRPRGRVRHVQLAAGSIFDALVELYSAIILTNFQPFSKLTPLNANETNAAYSRRLSIAYISGWFLDLYYCLRKATELKDYQGFSAYFQRWSGNCSPIYDNYLVQLNALIRPTLVSYLHEESLFVPYFEEAFHNDDNPFSIPSWREDIDLCHGIINTMVAKKEFKMSQLKIGSTDGRPIWLFDWYNNNTQCLSWFPFENNYTLDDAAVALILGAPMTSRIGPRETDDAQKVPPNIRENQLAQLPRLRPRYYRGAYEIRNYEFWYARFIENPAPTGYEDYDPLIPRYNAPSPPVITADRGKKRRPEGEFTEAHPAHTAGETSGGTEHIITAKMYRITDFIYNCMLAERLDLAGRRRSHKTFVLTK